MLIYAHRTGRGLAAENTLDGCARCLQLGVDLIDVDICMTKDEILVTTHDVTLNPAITRLPTGAFITEKIPLQALTFNELQKYDVGKIDPTSPYATYFPDQIESEKAMIPSLREVIERVKEHKVDLQIEIKIDQPITPPPSIFVKKLNQLLIETEMETRVEVQSFNVDCLTLLQSLNPEIKTSYVTKGELSPEIVTSLGGRCWALYEMDATEEAVKRAQSLGIKVLAWGYPEEEGTEFNQEQILKLIEWGIDGVITDRPDKLKQIREFENENVD